MLKRGTPSTWDWDVRLPFVTFAYNVTPSEGTGLAPYTLMFGRQVRFPSSLDIEFVTNPNYTVDEETYLQFFNENLDKLIEQARQELSVTRERNRIQFNRKPNVTEEKFQIGDRVMLSFPAEKLRGNQKKLNWTNFGPFRIIQTTDSTAQLVPTDKNNAKPFSMPLERLIRVPNEIPDETILPKHRIRMHELRNRVAETGPQVGSVRWVSGTKLPSNEEDAAEIDLFAPCDPTVEGHEQCEPLLGYRFDALISRESTFGRARVNTIAKAVLVAHLFRKEKFLKAEVQAQDLTAVQPGSEIVAFVGLRPGNKPQSVIPSNGDFRRAVDKVFRYCVQLRRSLRQKGNAPIRYKFDGLKSLLSNERKEWDEYFEGTKETVEELRAKLVFKAHHYVTAPQVVFGDDTVLELQICMPNADVHHERTIEGAARRLAATAFSSKVASLLIVIGNNELNAGETAKEMLAAAAQLAEQCNKHHRVAITWAVSPYNYDKADSFYEYINGLRLVLQRTHVRYAVVGPEYRSLIEIFRYGSGFNHRVVNAFGKLLPAGVRQYASLLNAVFGVPIELPVPRPSPAAPSAYSQASSHCRHDSSDKPLKRAAGSGHRDLSSSASTVKKALKRY